jgi:hypothetical protein
MACQSGGSSPLAGGSFSVGPSALPLAAAFRGIQVAAIN